jgi:hypothetical protein
MYFYMWRNAQLEQVEERVKQQQLSLQPYRALKTLEMEIAVTAVPTLVRLPYPAVFEDFKLNITNDDFEDGSSNAGSHSSAGADNGNSSDDSAHAGSDLGRGSSGDEESCSDINESNKDKRGSGGDANDDDNAANGDDDDSGLKISAWDITASEALPGLRILHLSFFHFTLLRTPAVMSLRARAPISKS